MAIDQDKAGALRAQIEQIRTAEIIPDPEDEAEGGEWAQLAHWINRKIEENKGEGSYCHYVPLNDAMAPNYPNGECVIFRECGGGAPEPKDGDIVVATLCVADIPVDGFQEFQELAHVIRRYSRLPDGRTQLTPLKEDFRSWTDGDLTQYGILDICVMGVAVPHQGVVVDPDSGIAIFIRESKAAA